VVRAAGCLQTGALCIGATGVSKQGWLDIPSRTLMRSPVVKRRTSPASGFFAFFPLFRSGHRRHPVTCPDGISRCRGSGRVTAPHTYGGARTVETTIGGLLSAPCDRETSLDPHSVLRQVVAARVSFASSSQVRGRGSPRCTGATIAVGNGAGAGVQSQAQGSGIGGLRTQARSMTPGIRACRGLDRGSSPWWPVRRQAHPLPALIRGCTGPAERPLRVCACHRPRGPIDRPGSSAPSPGHVCSPGGLGSSALWGGPGGRAPRLPSTPSSDRRCRCSCRLSQRGCPLMLWHT
jgi:hypothetical protein